MFKKLFFALLLTSLFACTDSKGTIKTLERSGFRPISVGGFDYFGLTKHDTHSTRFKAIAVNGDTVTGCVTKGWFRGSVIRLDD